MSDCDGGTLAEPKLVASVPRQGRFLPADSVAVAGEYWPSNSRPVGTGPKHSDSRESRDTGAKL